jgi:hypothetical protein
MLTEDKSDRTFLSVNELACNNESETLSPGMNFPSSARPLIHPPTDLPTHILYLSKFSIFIDPSIDLPAHAPASPS